MAVVSALWRHPIKGFTAQLLDRVDLAAGGWFPGDRLFAVEDGPSGFDPAAPAFVSKTRFTVLARLPQVARVVARFDDAARTLHLAAPDRPDLTCAVDDPGDRARLEAWLTDLLGEDVTGPLRLISAEGLDHRFMDDMAGRVSILNLASVRDLETRLGAPVDPRRFRANVWVEGWPAWIENDAAGQTLSLGAARLTAVKPIVRCAATHVHPDRGERDLDLVPELFRLYGHRWCGLYARIDADGPLAVGDPVEP